MYTLCFKFERSCSVVFFFCLDFRLLVISFFVNKGTTTYFSRNIQCNELKIQFKKIYNLIAKNSCRCKNKCNCAVSFIIIITQCTHNYSLVMCNITRLVKADSLYFSFLHNTK